MGGGPQVTTSSSAPPPAFMAAYQDLINRAQGVAGQPLQQYTGNVVAGLSDDQQSAIDSIRSAQGITSPYLNSAAQMYGSAADQAGQTSQNAANATWGGVNSQIAQGQEASHDAAHATWDAVTGKANAATDAAAAYGSAATGIAGSAGSNANAVAGESGDAARGIAGAAGQQANQGAQTGAGIALQGAQSNAMRANQAAGQNVWGQLPSFQSGIDQYMSPYNAGVIAPTQALFANQNAQQQEGLKSNAISQGAWGGDRAGVAQGILGGQQALAQAPVLAQLQAQGFDKATQQYNTDKALQAQLGQSRANLMSSTALGAGNLLNSSGLGAGQLTSGTALGAGSLGANTTLGAGNLGASTQLGAGNLGVNANLGAGNMNVNANLGAANVLGSTGTAIMNNALQSGIGAANTLGSTGTAIGNMGINAANTGINAAHGIQGVGTDAQTAALQGAAAQMSAGDLTRGIQQQQLNVPYQQFQQQQAYPFQTTGWLAQMLGGVGGLGGGTSSTSQPGPDLFSQLLGAGTTLGSAFLMSDERVKEDIKPIGKTKDGQTIYRYRYKGQPGHQIGLLAQEVEDKHPDAVAEDASGIKGVDYKAATEDSVRARGGGILDDAKIADNQQIDPPDMSISFIPDAKTGNPGGGPPKPPEPFHDKESDSTGKDLGGLAAAGIKKYKSDHATPDMDWINGYGASAMDAANAGVFGSIGARRGGSIKRADGGGIDERFDAPLKTAGGISIPQLSTKPRAKVETKENLKHDYGNNPNDADGHSVLPHSTYKPPVAPWDGSSTYVGGTYGGGGGGGLDDQFRRGGPVRRAAGGIMDDEEDDGSDDQDDDSSGISAGAAQPAFNTHDIEAQPDGAGIAPPQYKSNYKPREYVDHTAEDKKTSLRDALMTAGLSMMAGRSHNFLSNVGQGGLAGMQSWVASRQKNSERQDREQREADASQARAATLEMNAQRFGDQVKTQRARFAQQGAHIEHQDEIADRKLALGEKRALEGNWEYVGQTAGPDGKAVGQYMNKKTGMTKTGPLATKAGAGSISPETKRFVAERYLAGDKSAIQGFARNPQMRAELEDEIRVVSNEQGRSASEVVADLAQYHADAKALDSLATRSARIDVNVRNASKAATLVEQLSANVNRTQFRPINTVINAFRSNTGDVPTRQLGSALNTFLNEYASAVAGNAGMTVSGREHAEHLLSQADSDEALRGVIKVLQQEMNMALKSPEEVRDDIMGRIIGHRGSTRPDADHGGAAPNAQQIERLKANPALAKDFDEKFGDGASKKILGTP